MIDIYGTLGGSSSWKSSYSPCGCVRPRLLQQQQAQQQAEQVELGAADGANSNCTADGVYCKAQGFLPSGNDIQHANLTFDQAIAACTKNGADCAGITFKQNNSRPASAVPVYLKRCSGIDPCCT